MEKKSAEEMGEGYEYVGVYVRDHVKKRGFPYRESRVVAK